jgi:hypothetical protein
MVHKLFQISYVVFFVSIAVAAPAPGHASTAVLTHAEKINDDTSAKLVLVRELMKIQDFEINVDGGIKGADAYLSRPQMDPLAQKAYADAKAKFDLQKEKIRKDMIDSMEQDLMGQFTLTELKYIVDFSKYPLYKKFKTFMESEKYYTRLGKPVKDAREILNESKKKYGVKDDIKSSAAKAPKKFGKPVNK